jgi:hypothetical protein
LHFNPTTHDASHLVPEVAEAFDFICEQINLDGFGNSVPSEVGNHARRMLRIKGQQIGL